MHDVLAHRLSILSVHAGALENAGDALPPEYTETARRDPHERARGAGGAAAGDRAAAARGGRRASSRRSRRWREIPALVEESRVGGARRSRYRERGRAATCPELVGRTAYRTVQEGLTNARKHGGRRARRR